MTRLALNRNKNQNIETNHKLIIPIKTEQYRMPIGNKYTESTILLAFTVTIHPIFPEKYFSHPAQITKKDNKIMSL